MTRIKTIIIAVVVVSLGAVFASYRVAIKEAVLGWQKEELPEAREFQGSSFKFQDKNEAGSSLQNDINQQPISNNQFPISYNLAVPFQPQAPFANWGLPYQEACEEAALIMAERFFRNAKDFSAQDMDSAIQYLVAWEEKRFGYYQDTTADEVATIAREYFGLKAEVSREVTVENIKQHIAANHLILVPAAGKILPNPYFRNNGPLYHMLVIRGYTPDKFITNDPGTKRGKEFTYRHDDLLNAVHDWPAFAKASAGKPQVTEQDMLKGEKVMIIVSGLAD